MKYFHDKVNDPKRQKTFKLPLIFLLLFTLPITSYLYEFVRYYFSCVLCYFSYLCVYFL